MPHFLGSNPAAFQAGHGRGRHGASWFRTLGLALALLAAGLRPAAPTAAQSGVPRFEPGLCDFSAGVIPAGERVDCGFLVVSENRASQSENTIRLAVAILRSRNSAPAPDPIIYLADGPGLSGLDQIDYFLGAGAALRAGRDIVLLDQRGTGRSMPSLRCWEFDSVLRSTRAQRVPPDKALELDMQTAAVCRDRLLNAGVDLAAYNTAESAADVKDLRISLAIAEWNLYGIGYGTRLALAVLRDFPSGVRSVVLDSALPPQANTFETAGANLDRALGRLFADCAAQPACDRAFPGLAARFLDAATQYDLGPVTIQTADPLTGELGPRRVAGDTVIGLVADGLLDAGAIPYLPLAVARVERGGVPALENLFAGLPAPPDAAHSGLWYSVQCHDAAPFTDRSRVQADAQAYPRLRTYIQRDTTLAVCAEWPAGQAQAAPTEPVRSDVPALVLAGALDPRQPPLWGQIVASTLRGSFYYELPAAGHGASLSACGRVIVLQLVEHPAVPPSQGCVAAEPAPQFATAAYFNPGVYRAAGWLLVRPDARQWLPYLLCAAVFLLGLLAWLVAAVRHGAAPAARAAGYALWLAILTGLVDIVFAAALVGLIAQTYAQQPGLLIFGLPREAAPLFVAPWLAAVMGIILVLLALLAWLRRYWSVRGRVYFTLVALAAAGFAGLLFQLGLMSR
jgi:pimeloyl-ACP methyl ester carboxylesterase